MLSLFDSARTVIPVEFKSIDAAKIAENTLAFLSFIDNFSFLLNSYVAPTLLFASIRLSRKFFQLIRVVVH